MSFETSQANEVQPRNLSVAEGIGFVAVCGTLGATAFAVANESLGSSELASTSSLSIVGFSVGVGVAIKSLLSKEK